MAIYSGGLYDSYGLAGIFSSGGVFVGGSVSFEGLSVEGKGSTELGKVGLYGLVFLNKSASLRASTLKGACSSLESLTGEKALTNYGKYILLQCMVRQVYPEYFRLVLCTDDSSGTYRPTEKSENFSALREISQGHGYIQGGVKLNFDEIDFPGLDVISATNMAYAQLRSVTFTALGGNLPYGGNAIRYAVLLDDLNKVVAYYVLSEVGITLTRGQSMAVQSFRISLS